MFYRLPVVLLLFLFSISSCRKQDDPDKIPLPSSIKMEAEGGSETISLGKDGWKVTSILNQDGNQRMFGNILTPDGQVSKENVLLELDGPGSLEGTLTEGRGFTIVYDGDRITITLSENGADEIFRFKIVLTRDGDTTEIIVEQDVSQGYTFREISYSLGEGDGDSLYTKAGTRYEFNLTAPQQITISPFGGVEIVRMAGFESDQHDAFFWLASDSVEVEVPVHIRDGVIETRKNGDVYGARMRMPYDPGDIKAAIDVPAGGAQFVSELEWRRRRVSYRLVIENNRTGQLKEIIGKWTEVTPTGNYRVLSTVM